MVVRSIRNIWRPARGRQEPQEALDLTDCGLESSFATALGSVILEQKASEAGGEEGCCWPKLATLRLKTNRCLGATLREPDVFAKGLAALPGLEALDLTDCGLESSFATALGLAIRRFAEARWCWPKLQELRIGSNNSLGSTLKDPSPFVEGVATLPELKVLDLSKCGLESSFAKAMGSAFLEKTKANGAQRGGGGHCYWPKLTTLMFVHNANLGADLSDPGAFAKSLAALPELEALDLTDCGLDSSFAAALGSGILGTERAAASPGRGEGRCCWPKLKKLRFKTNRQLGADLSDPNTFAKGLAALPELEVLDLTDCSLEASFSKALGSAILEKVEIATKASQSAGAADWCWCWPKLKELRFAFNHCLGKDLDPSEFLEGLTTLPELEALDLTQTGLEFTFASALGSTILKKREAAMPQKGGGGRCCWPKLKTLMFLENNQLGTGLDDPRSFAEGLAALPELEALDLSSCGLESSFALALSNTIPAMHEKERMVSVVAETPEAEAEAEVEARAGAGSGDEEGCCCSWQKLKQLELHVNCFSAEAVSSLEIFAKERPEVEICLDGQRPPETMKPTRRSRGARKSCTVCLPLSNGKAEDSTLEEQDQDQVSDQDSLLAETAESQKTVLPPMPPPTSDCEGPEEDLGDPETPPTTLSSTLDAQEVQGDTPPSTTTVLGSAGSLGRSSRTPKRPRCT